MKEASDYVNLKEAEKIWRDLDATVPAKLPVAAIKASRLLPQLIAEVASLRTYLPKELQAEIKALEH